MRDKKIAAFAAGFSGLPGNKYPHLFSFYAVPVPGHTPQEMGDAIHAEIDRLKKEDISDDELKMIKTRAKADLIRGLADNEGLAQQLAIYQSRYGDWRELFRSVDRIDKVTKADIRRVANQTFTENNRTVGINETIESMRAPRKGVRNNEAHFPGFLHAPLLRPLPALSVDGDSSRSALASGPDATGSKFLFPPCRRFIPLNRSASNCPTAW